MWDTHPKPGFQLVEHSSSSDNDSQESEDHSQHAAEHLIFEPLAQPEHSEDPHHTEDAHQGLKRGKAWDF